jgi:hypothetical protein
VIGVIPALDLWDTIGGTAGVFALGMFLLAHLGDVAERLSGADPDHFFGHFLDSWSSTPGAIPDDVRADYLAPMRQPGAIHAVWADYQASAFVDPGHDALDRSAGHRLRMPVLAVWEDPGDTPLSLEHGLIERPVGSGRRHLLPVALHRRRTEPHQRARRPNDRQQAVDGAGRGGPHDRARTGAHNRSAIRTRQVPSRTENDSVAS